VPTAHAPLIERYLAVGFVVVGKTNTPELGLMPVTEPAARGPSRKPWDPARTPGGSSGGAGAAVASGMVPAAHGGDGGGSIRIPAACCGLFGLKPSRGRMPNSPPCDVWLDGVIEHGLTRSVRDSAALLDVSALGERESRLPRPGSGFLAEVGQPAGPMRVAVVREPLLEATFTKDCHDALEVACKLCADLGYELIEAEPEIDRKRFATAFARMLCAEVAAELRQAAVILKRRVRRDEFEVITWALGLLGQAIPAVELLQAQRDINEIAREFAAWTVGFDVVMTPTLAQPPPRISALLPGGIDALVLNVLGRLHAGWVLRALGMVEQLAADAFAFIPTTPLFNMNGQPAMSVPLHWTADGLPIGMHFSAALGDEARLFRLAGELESAAPWAARRPPEG
jgi:amidase